MYVGCASIGHESFVHWQIQILYLAKAPEYFTQMVFSDIFCQLLDNNLGASWGTIGARGAGETSIFVPTRVSTSTPREGSTAR